MVPQEVKCSQSHEWVRHDKETNIAEVGLTHYAIAQLGDIVYLELPEVGSTFAQGEEFGTIESVKAASGLLAPISGEIVEVNDKVPENLDIFKDEPYGSAWLIKVKLSDPIQLDALMDAHTYAEHLEGL